MYMPYSRVPWSPRFPRMELLLLLRQVEIECHALLPGTDELSWAYVQSQRPFPSQTADAFILTTPWLPPQLY